MAGKKTKLNNRRLRNSQKTYKNTRGLWQETRRLETRKLGLVNLTWELENRKLKTRIQNTRKQNGKDTAKNRTKGQE